METEKPSKVEIIVDDIEANELPVPQTQFVFEHHTCAMCEGPLEVEHKIRADELRVHEQAHCASCGVRVRSRYHLMH